MRNIINIENVKATDLLLRKISMSDEEHNTLIFERGCRFFENIAAPNPILIEFLSSSIIWDWWTELWYERNAVLVEKYNLHNNDNICIAAITMDFKYMHAITFDKVYPSRMLMSIICESRQKLDDSYGEIAQLLIKSKRK